jgi:hypothetical protein
VKVALVHDWLTGMRGGEKALEVVCERFPEAELFTLLHIPGSVAPVIERRSIHTSFIQHLPGSARHYRSYLPLFPSAIEQFSFEGFDRHASGRAPSLLLLHPDALRLGPVRGLLRTGPNWRRRERRHAAGDGQDGPLGPRNGESS